MSNRVESKQKEPLATVIPIKPESALQLASVSSDQGASREDTRRAICVGQGPDVPPGCITNVTVPNTPVVQALHALTGKDPSQTQDLVKLIRDYQSGVTGLDMNGSRSGEVFSLKVDGIIGPCTWRAMLHDMSEILAAGKDHPRYDAVVTALRAIFPEASASATPEQLGKLLSEKLTELSSSFTQRDAFVGLNLPASRYQELVPQFMEQLKNANAMDFAGRFKGRKSLPIDPNQFHVEASEEEIEEYVNQNYAAFGLARPINRDQARRIIDVLRLIRSAESGNGMGIEGYSAANPTSSARGAYQFMNQTVADLRAWGVVSGNFPSNNSAQDRLAQDFAAIALIGLKRDVLDLIVSGQNHAGALRVLSMEWAGLPQDGSGRSYYDGYAGNHATVSHTTAMRALGASPAIA